MRGKRSNSDEDKATNEKVEAAIKGIEDLYSLGRDSRKSRKRRPVKRSDGFLDSEAEKRGVDPHTLEDARQLAHSERGYSKTDLKNLIALIREQHESNLKRGKQTEQEDKKKSIFTKVFLLRLLTVRDREQRWELLEKVIREGWTYRQLKSELAKRYGRSWEFGARPRISEILDDVYVQIETLCQSWLRWHEAFADSISEKKLSLKRGKGKLIRSLAGNAKKLSMRLDSLLSKWHKALKKWHEALRDSVESPSTRRETRLTKPTELLANTTKKFVERLEDWAGEELRRQFPGRKDSRADKRQQSGPKRTKLEEKAPKRQLQRR